MIGLKKIGRHTVFLFSTESETLKGRSPKPKKGKLCRKVLSAQGKALRFKHRAEAARSKGA